MSDFKDYKLVNRDTGEELIVDQEYKTFRDEICTLEGAYAPGTSAGGMNGRVYLRIGELAALYFPSVIKAKFVKKDVEDEPIEKLDTMRSVERRSWREKGFDD
jgi:hypothetical protein